MRNDPPTNLRRGHGFREARAAGAPYIQPRPIYRANWDIEDRRCGELLKALIRAEPSIGILAQEKMEAMKTGVVWVRPDYAFEITRQWCGSAAMLYYFVLYDRPEFASKEYWDRVRKKYQWPVPPQSK